MPKYVIIGGSAAGIGAVEAIREIDPAETIAVISEEPRPHYSRPMIADFICGKASPEKMKYRDDDFWDKNGVQKFLGRKASDINLKDKYVRLENGDRIDFERLLIATGSRPYVPKIDGADKKGVFTFLTFSDAQRLEEEVEHGKNGVVIGGGLIGVSAAEALTKCGLNVTIVEFKDRILNLILDQKASEIAEKTIRKEGVTIITGQTVQKILGKPSDDNTVGGVVLTNKEMIPCDLVIIAIGVVPRTELAMGTGIKINRGILVDRFMETNIADVYACGDAAEAFDFILDDNRQLPLFPLAHEGGKVAGYNMAGRRAKYQGGTSMSSLNYFNLPIVSVGISTPGEDENYEVLTNQDPGRDVYKKIVLRDNIVVGMIMVNDIKRAGIIFYLMKNLIDVGEFKQKLISEDFGLVSLPEKLRKRMLRGNQDEGY